MNTSTDAIALPAMGEWRTREVPCNLCGQREVRVLWTKDAFRYVECRSCSLVYVNPQLLPSEIERIYAVGFGSKSASKPLPKDFSGYAPLLRWARRYRTTGRLLDIGCFTGHLLLAARADGWTDPHGTEISREAAAHARGHGFAVHCGGLDGARYPEAGFDAVLMLDVVEHLSDPGAYLREIRRVLRPGGGLYLETPNFNSVTRYALGREWAAVFPWHQFYFRPAVLRRMLQTAGLEVRYMRCEGIAPLSRYNALRALYARREIARQASSLKSIARRRLPWARRVWFAARAAGNLPFTALSMAGIHLGTKMIIAAERPE